MKISIITICYNNERDIRQTIESVVNQTYPDIEYIIKDGESKDSTLSIVEEYKNKISQIISCPDKGIYDALNQGIKAATGEIVGFIHAGDRLYENTTIEKIAKFHQENKLDISYGGSVNVNIAGKIVRLNRSPRILSISWIKLGWMPSHMSIYTNRRVFEKYGVYRTDMPIAADYEWFLRCFYKHGDEFRIQGMPGFTLFFQLGGISSHDGFNKFKSQQKKMLEACWHSNGLTPPPCIIYLRLWWAVRNILQYFWEAKVLQKTEFK